MGKIARTKTLYNGIEIPSVGYGTFLLDNEIVRLTVQTALAAGYRLIDTASMYQNEEGIGKGLRDSGVPREEVFIMSKLWNSEHGFHGALKAFSQSRERLDTDYIDLYLIHWPKEENLETWSALEKLYKDGKVRAIGVSNFKIHHLQEIIDSCEIIPMINQVELHPQYAQQRLRGFCDKFDILISSWAPLMRGNVKDIPLLQKMAEKYAKTPAQIMLRWHLQLGVIPLPKSVREAHIRENIDIFDFELSREEMAAFGQLKGKRLGPDPDIMAF